MTRAGKRSFRREQTGRGTRTTKPPPVGRCGLRVAFGLTGNLFFVCVDGDSLHMAGPLALCVNLLRRFVKICGRQTMSKRRRDSDDDSDERKKKKKKKAKKEHKKETSTRKARSPRDIQGTTTTPSTILSCRCRVLTTRRVATRKAATRRAATRRASMRSRMSKRRGARRWHPCAPKRRG